MISVIIPTIWKCNKFLFKSLDLINDHPLLKEIIIINNDTTNTPKDKLLQKEKIKILDQEKNLFFNKSVNIGVDYSTSEICCVCNDDIFFDQKIFDYVVSNYTNNSGCFFISPKSIKNEAGSFLRPATSPNKSNLINYKTTINHGPGMLMFFAKSKFHKIPEELIHHWGDIFIKQSMEAKKLKNFLIEGFIVHTFGKYGSASEKFALNEIQKDRKRYQTIIRKSIKTLILNN